MINLSTEANNMDPHHCWSFVIEASLTLKRQEKMHLKNDVLAEVVCC